MAVLEVRRPIGRYEDGAEAELLAIMDGAQDRSTTSPELRAAIHDWPTEYHLSSTRANLLAPLRLGPGDRVLEVGAGTGVLSRWLGEQGCEVVAVEGSLSRAEVAAARCTDLDHVRVICGGADEVDPDEDGRFDAVLLIGVLEYASTGGLPSAEELLAACAGLVAPGGVLVLAIENQLGVQYLSGAPEDHWVQPGVGVEGYVRPAPRTYHRRALGALVAQAGLPAQRWLFPYPDYKLPVAVLSEGAYDALPARVVDSVVRQVASTHHGSWPRPYDLRLAHATLVDAGLGPDVANSFLVVAGRDPADAARVVPDDVLAWLEGHGRRPAWLRRRTIATGEAGIEVRTEGGAIERTGEWITQRSPASTPLVPGVDLAQEAFLACTREDGDGLDAVLRRWVATVDRATVDGEQTRDRATVDGEQTRDRATVDGEQTRDRATVDGEQTRDRAVEHPFRSATTTRWLAADHLDVDLGNFVPDADGRLVYVDDEWVASGPVDRDVVALRALWNFARLMVVRGVAFPGTSTTTVDELALLLAERAGIDADEGVLATWHRAERALQDLVVGSRPDQVESWLDGSLSVAGIAAAQPVPATRQERVAAELSALAAERMAVIDATNVALAEARAQHAAAEARRFPHRVKVVVGPRLPGPVRSAGGRAYRWLRSLAGAARPT